MPKFRQRLFALLLALTLLGGIPSSAMAQGMQWSASTRQQEQGESPAQDEANPAQEERAMEREQLPAERELLTDKSTEFESYYRNPDGTYRYEVSTVQQRYRTEDGTYAEIDNQIVPIDQSAQSTDPFKAQGYDYRTKASQYWVLMKQNVSQNQTVAVAFGDRRIAFSPIHQADLDQPGPVATAVPQLEEREMEETELEPERPIWTPVPEREQQPVTPEPTQLQQPMRPDQTAPASTPHFQQAGEELEQPAALSPQTAEPGDSAQQPARNEGSAQGTQHEEPQESAQETLRQQARKDSSKLKFHATQESIQTNLRQNQMYNEEVYSANYEYKSVTYTNAYGQGIDMELTPHAAGVKENIILNQNPQDNRFAAVITLPKGYTMELENGDIAHILDEKGEKKAMIPDPFMVDSAMEEERENLSYDIAVTLTRQADGSYLYMLEPSRAYLDDPTVVYPVKIDPNITLMTPDKIQDTDVCNTSPKRNYYTTANLRVGRDSGNNVFRSLLRFNMPAELNGKYVRLLSLGTYQAYNGASSPEHYVQQLTTDWNSSTATWNNQPGYGEIYGRQTITTVKRYYWNLRVALRKWQNGTYPNYGVAIISAAENVQRYKRYYSSDAPQEPIHFGIDYAETNFTASVAGKGTGSAKCDITIQLPSVPYETWDPDFYFKVHMAKMNASGGWDGYVAQGANDGRLAAGTRTKVISNADADGRKKKIRVQYCNDYGVCATVEKIVDTPDLTPPQIGGSVTASKLTDSPPVVKIVFPAATDVSGISKYHVTWAKESAPNTKYNLPDLTSLTATYNAQSNNFPSGQKIRFSIKARDNKGNVSGEIYSNWVQVPNYTPPNAPAVTIQNGSGQSYGSGQTPAFAIGDRLTFAWTVQAGTFGISAVEYRLNNGTYQNIPASLWNNQSGTILNNSVTLTNSYLPTPDGTHTLYLRVKDNHSNPAERKYSAAASVTFKRDTTAPAISLPKPTGTHGQHNGVPILTASDSVTITSITDANLASVVVQAIPHNLQQDTLDEAHAVTLFSGNASTAFPKQVNLNGHNLPERLYTLRIHAQDTVGNSSFKDEQFFFVQTAQTDARTIRLYDPAQTEAGQNILVQTRTKTLAYQALEGMTLPANATAELFVDNQKVPVLVHDAAAHTITVDVLHPQNRDLFNGTMQSIHLELVAQDGTRAVSAPVFTVVGDVPLEAGSFETLTGFVANGATLTKAAQTQTATFTTAQSEQSFGLLGDVRITALEGLPEGAQANLSIVFTNEDGTSVTVPAQVNERIAAPGPYTRYQLTGTVSGSEEMCITRLSVERTFKGQNDTVQTELVPQASELSAFAQANYTTWLRWNYDAQRVTAPRFDVYRIKASDVPADADPLVYFAQAQLLAENLEAPYFYDYNLMYGQSFLYYIVVKQDFANEGEAPVYACSKPICLTDGVTMVAEGELDKNLGLQNHWSFLAQAAGNGSAYVNVDNGNLVYQKTDFSLAGPVLATVMRRTYNSQSTSNTVLGRGWDFNLNTNLLIEYEMGENGPQEAGLILKDGDGSLHRYQKQADGTYKRPDGIFITLEEQVSNEAGATLPTRTFIARRSDDIAYHFNANMMIEKFVEPNGHALEFTYDSKGRLRTVTHSLYTSGQVSDAQKQYVEFFYGEEVNQELLGDDLLRVQDRLARAVLHYGSEQQVFDYTYAWVDDDNHALGGILNQARTSLFRPGAPVTEEGVRVEQPQPLPETVFYETYAYRSTSDAAFGTAFVLDTKGNANQTDRRVTTFAIDAAGRVTRATDAEGDYVNIAYAAAGGAYADTVQKTTATNYIDGANVGQSVFFTDRAKDGAVIETISSTGQRVVYGNFTADYQPQRVHTYTSGAQTQEVVQQFAYDSLGRLIRMTNPEGKVTTLSYQGDTRWVTQEELKQGDTVLNRAVYAYDAHGNRTSQTIYAQNLSDARTTQYQYADADLPGLLTRETAWNGKQTNYAYDALGRLQQSSVVGAGRTLTTAYTYDAFNNPTSSTLVRGGGNDVVTQYKYDQLGYLVQTEYATGQIVYNTYNDNGLLTSTLFTGGEKGQTWEQQENAYTYDNTDRLISARDPMGVVTTTQLSATSSAVTTTTQVKQGSGVARTITSQQATNGSYTQQTMGGVGVKNLYDYRGLLTGTQEVGGGQSSTLEHDLMGRTTRATKNMHDAESRVDYDAYGNVAKEWTYVQTDGDVKKYGVRTYTYDLLGRVLTAKEYDGLYAYGAALGNAYATTAYAYEQNRQSNGEYSNTSTTADGLRTVTTYNQLGQVIKEEQFGKDNAAGAHTLGAYMAKAWTYDEYGRQTGMQAWDGNSMAERVTYTYDKYDRLVREQQDAAHYTTYAYDHMNRTKRTEVHTEVDGQAVMIPTDTVYDANNRVFQQVQDGKEVNYLYHATGELAEIQYGDGDGQRVVLYTYDDAGRPTAVKTRLDTFDAQGERMEGAVKTVKTYAYANNRLATETEYLEFDEKPDGQGKTLTGTYTWNNAWYASGLTYSDGTAQEQMSQTRDARGYLTQVSYQGTHSSLQRSVSESYGYDAIGRLTQRQAQKQSGIAPTQTFTTTYGYDVGNNKLYETQQEGDEITTRKYVYNGLNQLTSVQIGQGAYSAVSTWIETGSYTYDAFGNRISETQYAYSFEAGNNQLHKQVEYVYDKANQLTAIKEKAADASDFTVQSQSVYDGTGQRVRKYVGEGGTYEKHYYVGTNPLLQTTQSGGNVIGENILDANGKVIASRREDAQGGGSRYWLYHYDLQGKMVSMAGVDAQGNLSYGEYNEYDPYGKPEAGSTSDVKNDVKYMGGVCDASGLYYLNARHYDANTGRFLQQDTYKGNPYAPWTQNLYAYCNNNPTSFIDPTGHIAVIDAMVNWLKENTQRLIEINFENNVRAHAQSRPEWQSATTQEEKKRIENRTKQEFNTILKSEKEVRTVTDNTGREGFNILFRVSEDAPLQYGETQASQTGRVAQRDVEEAQEMIRKEVGDGVIFEGMTHGHHDDLTAYAGSKHYLSLDDMRFSTSWLNGNLYVVNKSGYVEGFDQERYLADGGKPIDVQKFVGDMYNEQAERIYAEEYAPYIFGVGSIYKEK